MPHQTLTLGCNQFNICSFFLVKKEKKTVDKTMEDFTTIFPKKLWQFTDKERTSVEYYDRLHPEWTRYYKEKEIKISHVCHWSVLCIMKTWRFASRFPLRQQLTSNPPKKVRTFFYPSFEEHAYVQSFMSVLLYRVDNHRNDLFRSQQRYVCVNKCLFPVQPNYFSQQITHPLFRITALLETITSILIL